MIKYYVQYRLYHSNGRPVRSFVGLIDSRSWYYQSESEAREHLDKSVSFLVANSFDLISPDGAISPKLMCPDGLHVLQIEVVRYLEIEGVMLRKS